MTPPREIGNEVWNAVVACHSAANQAGLALPSGSIVNLGLSAVQSCFDNKLGAIATDVCNGAIKVPDGDHVKDGFLKLNFFQRTLSDLFGHKCEKKVTGQVNGVLSGFGVNFDSCKAYFATMKMVENPVPPGYSTWEEFENDLAVNYPVSYDGSYYGGSAPPERYSYLCVRN